MLLSFVFYGTSRAIRYPGAGEVRRSESGPRGKGGVLREDPYRRKGEMGPEGVSRGGGARGETNNLHSL